MPHDFQPGDFLIFQLEAGFGLLRVLDVEGDIDNPVWHLAAYRDLFMDVDTTDAALEEPGNLTPEIRHAALTDRAFKSTQVSKMTNVPLQEEELVELKAWRNDPDRKISNRSIRLLLGLR